MKNRRCHFCKRRQQGRVTAVPTGPLLGAPELCPTKLGQRKGTETPSWQGTRDKRAHAWVSPSTGPQLPKKQGDLPTLQGPFLKVDECCRSTSAQPLMPQTQPFRVPWTLQSKVLPGCLAGLCQGSACTSPHHSMPIYCPALSAPNMRFFRGCFPTLLLSAFRQTPNWPDLTV